ncbi:MAG: helix-turn-helix domain-containing protein, partial [Gammaproteobacteria bacterium]|nr:helix-turn-helix domain-containing protein [Gammaproteobacteria bacterium]
MVYRNIRYRLYPKSRGKADLLCRCMGATRYVWNHFLGLNKTMMEAWRKDDSTPRPEVSFFSLGKAFTQLRQGTDWLLELPANPIKYTLKY